jgi:hypothetical protein
MISISEALPTWKKSFPSLATLGEDLTSLGAHTTLCHCPIASFLAAVNIQDSFLPLRDGFHRDKANRTLSISALLHPGKIYITTICPLEQHLCYGYTDFVTQDDMYKPGNG